MGMSLLCIGSGLGQNSGLSLAKLNDVRRSSVKIGAPRELAAGEARVALTPESAQFLQKLGHECLIETGAGAAAGFDDAAYRDAGVSVVESAEVLWREAEVVVKVREPSEAEAEDRKSTRLNSSHVAI